jgi:hypothetical protein
MAYFPESKMMMMMTAMIYYTKQPTDIYNIACCFMQVHVKWVHCHHGMVRPRVADRGDGLQIWWVAANILNRQSRTADRGWSSSLGVGRWAKNPSP